MALNCRHYKNYSFLICNDPEGNGLEERDVSFSHTVFYFSKDKRFSYEGKGTYNMSSANALNVDSLFYFISILFPCC